MKNLTYLLLLMLISCKDNKPDLELTLINKSINCISNLNSDNLYNKSTKYDSLYEKTSLNIVKYKLHNRSDKKYFIVLNSDFFENYNTFLVGKYSDKKMFTNCVNFSLYHNDSIVKSTYFDFFVFGKFINYKLHSDSFFYYDTIMNYKSKYLYNSKDSFDSRNINSIVKNYLIIYPNETKYFSTLTNLPLTNYKYTLAPWSVSVEDNKIYNAGLTLYNSKEYTKSFLSEDLKKEIKENGYTIFDGVIQSNKVPVKMISMPAKE